MTKLFAFVVSALLLGDVTLAGQFPSHNGVVGRTPSADSFERVRLCHDKPQPTTSSAPAPTSTQTVGQLRYKENSGACETTPNVYQASGYGQIAQNQSMFFWLFEARENADEAPLTMWMNGGPGATSMAGLFQENGPCRITQDGDAYTYNNFSWNNVSNVIYIDQPIGAGFSYGSLETMNSTQAAAAVWDFFQIFFSDEKFSKYAGREFGIWTESYGGHYGPAFAAYFLDQNDKINSGSLNGTTINLKTLGIGNGLTDALYQFPEYVSYAMSNPYQPTADASVSQSVNSSLFDKGGCISQIEECQKRGNGDEKGREVCGEAQIFCINNVLGPLIGDLDVYDVRVKNTTNYPPDITPLLTNQTFAELIGAESPFQFENEDIYENFILGGDWMVATYKADLEQVINAGVRTVIYDGDADFIVNFKGVENLLANLNGINFSSTDFSNYTVNGNPAGLVKNMEGTSLSYLRVFGAGHEVPAYNYTGLETGQAALQFFSQAWNGNELTST